MRMHYIVAPLHFSMCVAGVCKLAHVPTETVIAWLSRPEVISAMLVIYLALILRDVIAFLRWAWDSLGKRRKRPDQDS